MEPEIWALAFFAAVSQVAALVLYFSERQRAMRSDADWRKLVTTLSNKLAAKNIDAYQVMSEVDFPTKPPPVQQVEARIEDDMASALQNGGWRE